ncbi:MAG: AGE family epimerase/isomerase [Erysipelotrichaceae bacterium]|nr:AGE family epimerase/isomerase [Erysipelotrichaceae bacterium]
MDRKYMPDTAENREYLKELREELLDFGRSFPSPSGASYYLGSDGKPLKDRDLETWITCRMAHVYSLGCLLGYPGSGELVDCALKGLRTVLHDDAHGGFYPAVDKDLLPKAGKQCYAHAFVILAAASTLAAGRPGAEELLKDSTEVFLKYFWEEEKGLTRDTWNTEFTQCEPYRGLNANMHTVEAFLAAADVTGENTWRERAGRIICHVLEWAEDNHWRIPEHFDENWKPLYTYNSEKKDDPFKPYGATPGHGIEWARLISQWALSAYPEDKEKSGTYIEKACRLFERAVKDAWNADGACGIVYTTDWNGVPVVRDRMHWTLAEAINTSAVLYHITGKKEYAQLYSEFLRYLQECVHDPVNGSWFHQLDEYNRLKETVWPGKSDLYHALQATLIPLLEPSVSVVPAVKRNLFLEVTK